MTTFTHPHALDCAERSMDGEAATLLRDFQHGSTSLDAIARIAPLIGLLGSAVGFMNGLAYSAVGCGPGDFAGGIHEALVPLILSLPVAVFACGACFYLKHRAGTFDFEMRTRTLEVLNELAGLRSPQ